MAKKKPFNYIAYIPVASLAIGMIAGYVRFQAQAENTKDKVTIVEKKIEKLEEEGGKELEEVKKDNQEIEKNLTEMRVEQKYLQQSVVDLNNNLKELIQEIKKKK